MFLAAKRCAGTCIRTYNTWQRRGRPGGVPALIGAVIGTTPLPPPPQLNPASIFRDANEAERQIFFEHVRQRNLAGYEARVALMREINATAAVTASNGTATGTVTS